MKSLHVSILSGHTIGIKKYYYIPKDAEVLEDFMTNAHDALTIDDSQRLRQENQELKSTQAQDIAHLKREMDELRKFVFPGPVPQDKQMRKTYLKVVKSYYKDEKGIDIDVDDLSNNLE